MALFVWFCGLFFGFSLFLTVKQFNRFFFFRLESTLDLKLTVTPNSSGTGIFALHRCNQPLEVILMLAVSAKQYWDSIGQI